MRLCIVCGNPGHPAYKVHSEVEIRGCGADPGLIEVELLAHRAILGAIDPIEAAWEATPVEVKPKKKSTYKGTPQRREYMRKYMAARRAKGK